MTPRVLSAAFIASVLTAAVSLRAQSHHTIAYATFAPLSTAIFIANGDGHGERMLVPGPMADANPSFSSDGRSIAFVSSRTGDGAWIAFTSDRDSDGARASPDGASIVFYEAAPDDWLILGRTFPSPPVVSQIAKVDVSSGARTPLTTVKGRKLTPQMLADGRIAYLRSDTEEAPDQGHRRADYWSERIAFVDGRDGPSGRYTGVRWSADGRRQPRLAGSGRHRSRSCRPMAPASAG